MMKAYRLSMIAAIVIAAPMAVMNGCEYDVAQPQWEKDFQAPPVPAITQIEPDTVAKAGVNTITIRGENFASGQGNNIVYFGATIAEVFETSATSLRVRRPNLATDSCSVKVVSNSALLVARYPKKYRIDPVVEQYGGFRDNLALSVLAVDQAENLYVVETGTRNINKITPDGQRSVLPQPATRVPTDGRIGPGSRLYLPGNNRAIDVVDLTTGAVTRWLQLPQGKIVRVGDFDTNGYFYTGGAGTDLMIVAPDLTNKASGVYATGEIIAVRVFNDHVYVATRPNATSPATIWRSAIGDSGNVGPQELVIDMTTTAFASRTIKGITFAANGTMYIATDSPDPVLVVDPVTRNVELLYKGILSSFCKHLYWGAGNYFYIISGDTILGQTWTVFRVDAGSAGAPYYGQ